MHSWWHEGWDLLLTPTLAELPLKLGTIVNDPDNPMAPMRRAGDFVPFTPPFNTSGQPAISLPLEWTAEGLPVGVHGRRLRSRRHPDPHRQSARAGEPLGGPQAGDLSKECGRWDSNPHVLSNTGT